MEGSNFASHGQFLPGKWKGVLSAHSMRIRVCSHSNRDMSLQAWPQATGKI